MNENLSQPSKQNSPAIIGNHYVNLAISIMGMLIASYGNLVSELDIKKWCYLIGALLLLLSALLEKQKFLIALQIIISGGAAIAFTDYPPLYKEAVPIGLSILAIIYFIMTRQFNNLLTIFGCFGITVLAAGYAVTNPIIFFLGASVLMVYSYESFKQGVDIALLWAILNALFCVTATLAIYRMFF
jgi:hypothetical protein